MGDGQKITAVFVYVRYGDLIQHGARRRYMSMYLAVTQDYLYQNVSSRDVCPLFLVYLYVRLSELLVLEVLQAL